MSRRKSGGSESSRAPSSTKVKIDDGALLLNAQNLHDLSSRGDDDTAMNVVATSTTTLLGRKGDNGYGSAENAGDGQAPKRVTRSITVVEEQLEKLHPGANTSKMATFDGVFVPTFLNVLSILMFLRFGFVLGQTGVLGMAILLLVSYGINLLTTLSISAISTNGTVRGGGAYYMISRSLGPEFGGSIGVVFYIGQVLNR